VDSNASKYGFSVGPDCLCYAAPAQRGLTQSAGNDLVEKFLAELDRCWQEHGPEIFHTVIIAQPRLYFRALVMLAQLQERGSSKLSDLDRQRNRTEALLRLDALVTAEGVASEPSKVHRFAFHKVERCSGDGLRVASSHHQEPAAHPARPSASGCGS
jgi:hypothetical protein